MKAIIMAGGFGSRLMPLTSVQPKPMVKIIDKPIIQYTLELLKQNNINDVCLALGYLPNRIKSFITENNGFELNVSCVVENKPMGTAGSIKQCQDFLGKDDFIVISGDAIYDFDLTACVDRHYASGSKASIILCSHPEPLEFGLVSVDESNRILGFIEKPSWDKVETNLVNTGIYIFSNGILERIPDNTPWDFGKDVFPELLREGYPLYGFEAEGYWCDVGCPKAYRKCTREILEGKTRLSIPATAVVYGNITVVPPVYISGEAHISDGAVIGPNSVVGSESVIGRNSRITDSIIDGAVVMPDCTVDGSIMCHSSQAMQGVKISEGCVIGAETIIGSRAVLMPDVSIWPRQKIDSGQLINRNIVSGSLRCWPEFTGAGKMLGKYNSTLTPEICFALGAGCTKIGKTGIAASGSPASKTLASSLSCGISAAGGECFMMDITFAAGAAYTGHASGLAITAFVSESDGDVEISFTDINGMPISRDTERKLEAIFSGSRKLAAANFTEETRHIVGSSQLYIAAAKRICGFGLNKSNVKLNVLGNSVESNTLRAALTDFGCELVDNFGVPVFELYDGGNRLIAKDEFGHKIDWKHLLCIMAIIEMKCGTGKIAVPFEAPVAIDKIIEKFGNKALRLGRDEEALHIYINQPWLRDGIFAAMRITAAMSVLGSSLINIASGVPNFSTVSREVKLTATRGEAMRKLSCGCKFSNDGGSGLLYNVANGCARVRPAIDHEALLITAECATIEAAEELCGSIRDIIEES